MSTIRLPLSTQPVLERILDDIEEALRDHAGSLPVSLSSLRGELARKTLGDACLRATVIHELATQDEAALRAGFITYYFEQTRSNVRMFGELVRPLRGEELSVVGLLPFAERIAVPTTGSMLERAIEQARANLQQAASAQSALFVLVGLVASRTVDQNARQALDSLFQQARAVLFARMQQFESTHLRLALVSGEPARLQALRERIAREHYGPGKVVDHLLTRSERLPGISFGDATEALRDELARAVKTALAGA